MKLFTKIALFLSLGLFSITALDAQEMPAKSSKASTSFTIGYTDITIDYSSPAVRGRKIFGGLEEWGGVWRAGANARTTIEFSTDVTVGKEKTELKAGKYSIFMIPNEKEDWVVIFNSDTEGSAGEYDESKDVARVNVQARKGKAERLTYSIADQGLDRGYISMAWADKRVIIFINTPALETMMANVKEAVDGAENDAQKVNIYAAAIDLLIDVDPKRKVSAERIIKKAVEIGESPRLHYAIAKVNAVNEKYAEAVTSAKKAMELGDSDAEDRWYGFYKSAIQTSIDTWSKK
ncbi:MAG: DUF2911 domain-containing protein [Bacteroidota bacterium]